MDLNSMLNPVSDASAQALKTPQRTVSLAQPLPQSSPIYPPPQRTTSLPTAQYREPSLSVSPKTMPPPAPVPMATPSPTLSRKRSLSSDQQRTSQPALKKHKYQQPPVWARRESEGPYVPAPAPTTHRPSLQPTAPPPPRASAPPPPRPQNPNLEPSLDNNEPYNDFQRTIANWLWDQVIMAPDYGEGTHIEVEAKIGKLLDPNAQLTGLKERIKLPIRSEAVMDSDFKTKFESLMDMAQHKRLNDYLNQAVRFANDPGRKQMGYKHVRETDYFYDLPTTFLAQLHPGVKAAHERSHKSPRVRVTRDNKTKQITATILKLRMADIEVRCPNDDFDFRISVSLETAYPHPIEHLREHLERGVSQAREKDRLSYTHQGFQVDLTQVTPVSNRKDKVHELEIELEVDRLVHEARKIDEGLENDYLNLVGVFLNNIRVLNRAAKPPPLV